MQNNAIFLKKFNVNYSLKSLLNLLQYYFSFMFWFFGLNAYGILVPNQGWNPHFLHWKFKVLTTGPGKFQTTLFLWS